MTKGGITIVCMCELFTRYQFETIRWFGNCKEYEIAVKAPFNDIYFISHMYYLNGFSRAHLLNILYDFLRNKVSIYVKP